MYLSPRETGVKNKKNFMRPECQETSKYKEIDSKACLGRIIIETMHN